MMGDPWIGRFRKEALPKLVTEFRPEKVILFGSRVKGTAKEDSDIDAIVVSTYFEDVPFLKRMPLLLKKVSFPKHVDYICYTPKEYDRIKGKSSVIMGALKNAIEVAA